MHWCRSLSWIISSHIPLVFFLLWHAQMSAVKKSQLHNCHNNDGLSIRLVWPTCVCQHTCLNAYASDPIWLVNILEYAAVKQKRDPSGALRAFIDWVLTGSAAHEQASFLCCACCICSLNIGLCVVSTCSNDRVSCLQSVHCGRCPADSHSWIPLSFSLCISCVATFSDLKLHHHLESIEVERDLFLSSFPAA